VDVLQQAMEIQSGAAQPDVAAMLSQFIAARPADVMFMLDQLLGGAIPEVAALIDPGRVGMSGHSFGGWTTLMVTARDRRIRAALPLAPAGGWMPIATNPLAHALCFSRGRGVTPVYLDA